MACEMDLSCSESSVEICDDSPRTTPSQSSHHRRVIMLEYRVHDEAEACCELERLLSIEEHSMTPAEYLSGSSITAFQRGQAVDKIRTFGIQLKFRFPTLCLAFNLLDRYLAASPGLDPSILELAATACLSVAGKLEEVELPTSNYLIYQTMCGSLPGNAEDLTRMELAVLAALGWRALGVTAANMLDPLIGLLDLQSPCLQAAGGIELAYVASEGSKPLLALAARDVGFLKYKPSTLATAAVCTVLEEAGHPVSLLAVAEPLLHRFSASQKQQICECQNQLRELVQHTPVHTLLKNCQVEVIEDGRLIRVFVPGPGSPTSVLQTPIGSHGSIAGECSSHSDPLAVAVFSATEHADWQLDCGLGAPFLGASILGYEQGAV